VSTIVLPTALAELKDQRRWVCWKYKRSKTGKPTKVPYQPSDTKASTDDPSTWSTFDAVVAVIEGFDGIGFVLTNTDLAAFDIDNCRDKESGAIDPWAQDLIKRSGSYTEVSPSGTGIRIIGRGRGEEIHCKRKVANGVSCEIYRRATRYITVTGNALEDYSELADIDGVMDATFAELTGGSRDQQTASRGAESGEDLLAITIKQGEGGRFNGDRSSAEFYVINEMLRRGHDAAAILGVLLDRANGISEKVLEQSNPSKYAADQIGHAVKKITLSANENGKPYASQSNIRVAMLKLGIAIRHDVFADRTIVEGLSGFGPALDDAAMIRLRLLIDQLFRFLVSKEMIFDVVTDTARLRSFHPIRDYLDGLTWDGIERLDKWLIAYGGAEDSKYTRAIGRLLLVAAVRRVRKPGCKFDEIVVLESEQQGLNKSTAISIMAVREEWFSDSLAMTASGKEMIELLRGKWIIECPELSGMRKADIEHVKAQASRQADRGRLAYDRLRSDVPRQCVIFGTTNDSQYLKDTTGNRRFWPVKVKSFDLDALLQDRDQLWAEAATAEAAGESIRMDQSLWHDASEQQALRLISDPYCDALQNALAEIEDGKIASSTVWEILDVRPGSRTQEQNKRMGDAMLKLGWKRPNTAGTIKIGGKNVMGYVRGKEPRGLVIVVKDGYGHRAVTLTEKQQEEEIEKIKAAIRNALPM
jgi:predicted P-loop ATPase